MGEEDGSGERTMSNDMLLSGAPFVATPEGTAVERTASSRVVSSPVEKLTPGALNGSSEKYSCVVREAYPAHQSPQPPSALGKKVEHLVSTVNRDRGGVPG